MEFKKKFLLGLTLFTFLLTGCQFESDSFTIIWKNYDGTILEVDENVQKGETPSYDGKTPTRANDETYSYTWSGWDPRVKPVNSNQTYTATYSYEKIKSEYVIDFDLNGGSSPSYKGPVACETFSKDVFFFDCVKEGLNFRGWSYKGTKIFDEKGIQLANPALAKNMTFTALYSRTAKMTITSNINGAGEFTGEGEYPYNAYVDISVKAREGYEFVGWYYKGTLLSRTSNYKYRMWSEDVILEARFRLKSYLMKIYSNNDEYGLVSFNSLNYDYRSEYQEYRDYTTNVSIAAFSKTDVRFLGWYNSENKLVATEGVYSFVMPNYDYTLEAKWNYFKVSYNLNGGINSSFNPDHYTIESGKIKLNNPTKDGYEFVGWKYNDKYVSEIDPTWMDDIELNAIFTKNTSSYGVIPIFSEDKKTLTYGLYPQTNVDDATTIAELNKLTKVEFNGWYLYSREYYAKLVANPCYESYYEFNNGTTIRKGETYWFKCEPISWNVLSSGGGKYFILSSYLLDAQRYDDSSNNYKDSEIRSWLNKDFYKTAFSLGNQYIQTTIVDNSAPTTNSQSNRYVCENTVDKVFLPSYKDYEGFTSNESRECKTTDYARANGARYEDSRSYLYNGNYWTRSPIYDYSTGASIVSYIGSLFSNHVNSSNVGVRPSLYIDIV